MINCRRYAIVLPCCIYIPRVCAFLMRSRIICQTLVSRLAYYRGFRIIAYIGLCEARQSFISDGCANYAQYIPSLCRCFWAAECALVHLMHRPAIHRNRRKQMHKYSVANAPRCKWSQIDSSAAGVSEVHIILVSLIAHMRALHANGRCFRVGKFIDVWRTIIISPACVSSSLLIGQLNRIKV